MQKGPGRILGACATLALVGLLLACGRADAPAAADMAELDHGVGLMGQFDFPAARQVFAALVARFPGWYEARLDLAVATLNRQQAGDERAAAEQVAALAKERPQDLRPAYLLGLMALRTRSPKEAESFFRRVVDADPQDAYARYFLGQTALAQGRAADALVLFDAASAQDPRLRSALYGAAQALTRLGREDEAKARLEQFQQLRNNPLARLAEYKYSRMGEKAEAVNAQYGAALATVPPLPAGALFATAQPLRAAAGAAANAAAASVVDIDDDGKPDIFLPGGRGGQSLVALRRAGGYEAATDHPLAHFADVDFAAWGDIDNDGLTDVLLCRADAPPIMVRQGARGQWSRLDDPALRAIGGTRDCQLVDADNTGSLDVLAVTSRGARALLANDGSGKLRVITDRLPRPVRADDALQALATNLDNTGRLALIFLHGASAHEVLVPDGPWHWRAAPGFEAFAREPALAVVAADLDARGEPDLITLTPERGVRRWRRGGNGTWQAQTIIPAEGARSGGARAQLAVADLYGDGRLEVVLTSAAGIAAWRAGQSGYEPVWRLADPDVATWTLAPLDSKGPALIVQRLDGSAAVFPAGPGRLEFALVELSGRGEKTYRSNASGIGARVAARIAGRWNVLDTLRNSSGPGQSLVPMAIGLAGAPRIDYVSIDWSDGVFQTELALDKSALHRIQETQRQLASCPLIFAWDGNAYGFVGDVLGVGGIGFLLAPGRYVPSRPWENFLLPVDALRARAGRFEIKIGEPMQEVAYVDAVRLAAYDLPPGWNVVIDERMQTGPPEVTGRALYYRRETLPARAYNDRGEDLAGALRAADLVAADPGPHDTRFIGRLLADNVVTLEFDTDLDAAGGRPVLVADGWIEYPYSQTLFAAWQANADYRPPTLEARGADGQWRTVYREFGYPAGTPRRMALPLHALPRGTRALRLSTNQEIYWDRLSVAWSEPLAAIRHELAPQLAEVRSVGFPRRTTGSQQQPSYDYGRTVPLWDTRIQSGAYTDLGRVDELIAQVDDAVAIIGPGEEIHLEFDAQLPPVQPQWTRRFVLETHGWAKDMDLYTLDGDTVGPLPSSGKDAKRRDRLNEKYNTRLASGR